MTSVTQQAASKQSTRTNPSAPTGKDPSSQHESLPLSQPSRRTPYQLANPATGYVSTLSKEPQSRKPASTVRSPATASVELANSLDLSSQSDGMGWQDSAEGDTDPVEERRKLEAQMRLGPRNYAKPTVSHAHAANQNSILKKRLRDA